LIIKELIHQRFFYDVFGFMGVAEYIVKKSVGFFGPDSAISNQVA
jgi:hypothetical protein